MRNSIAFTLIELVVVIVLIGVMVVLAMPRFMEISKKAKMSSDDNVMAAFKTAANAKHMENILKGDNVWPGDLETDWNPFSLLEPSPPAVLDGQPVIQDVTWSYTTRYSPPLSQYIILCPHFKRNGSGVPVAGTVYVYYYADTGTAKAGSITAIDHGH